MSDQQTLPPFRIVRIQAIQDVKTDKESFFNEIAQTIKQKYENVERVDNALEFSMGKIKCQFRIEEIENFILLTSVIKYGNGYEIKNVIDRDMKSFDFPESILSSPSLKALPTFVIFIPLTDDEHQAKDLVEQYSHHLSKPAMGVGIVRGCLLSIFEPDPREEEQFNRLYFLSPLHPKDEASEKLVDETLSDIKHLVAYAAELSQLHGSCKSFFSALKPGEREISEKTEDFLWKLIGPDTVELETLESWLGYIMEREASLSAMIATMQGNRIEAESIVSKIENIFKKLNERGFEDYPRSLEMEVGAYRKIAKSFEDYIARSEALKARLGTIMDNVRTYLSLQQQKLTMEEQKASKEHLIRLVNLQEIFHKVEIFIVAVYMTEMARIIFEVVARETADLLTALFIPIALILAVGISRLLHRDRS